MLRLFRVSGKSMEPTIKSGSFACVIESNNYKIGDIVVVKINSNLKIIKRISKISNGRVLLNSENTATSSSLCDYAYYISDIIGKVIFKFNLREILNRINIFALKNIKKFKISIHKERKHDGIG